MNNSMNDKIYKIMIDNHVKMDILPLDEQKSFIRPEDDYDFHAYRILLLILICGKEVPNTSNYPAIIGRNKFAFYDFMIRYPIYLKQSIEKKNKTPLLRDLNLKDFEINFILSPMIKYVRGPWDKRYDSILNYMRSKQLIDLKMAPSTEKGTKNELFITLTDFGHNVANQIQSIEVDWVIRMEIINKLFTKRATDLAIGRFIENNFNELLIGCANYED